MFGMLLGAAMAVPMSGASDAWLVGKGWNKNNGLNKHEDDMMKYLEQMCDSLCKRL